MCFLRRHLYTGTAVDAWTAVCPFDCTVCIWPFCIVGVVTCIVKQEKCCDWFCFPVTFSPQQFTSHMLWKTTVQQYCQTKRVLFLRFNDTNKYELYKCFICLYILRVPNIWYLGILLILYLFTELFSKKRKKNTNKTNKTTTFKEFEIK
jgi:hypothetical protein